MPIRTAPLTLQVSTFTAVSAQYRMPGMISKIDLSRAFIIIGSMHSFNRSSHRREGLFISYTIELSQIPYATPLWLFWWRYSRQTLLISLRRWWHLAKSADLRRGSILYDSRGAVESRQYILTSVHCFPTSWPSYHRYARRLLSAQFHYDAPMAG